MTYKDKKGENDKKKKPTVPNDRTCFNAQCLKLKNETSTLQL